MRMKVKVSGYFENCLYMLKSEQQIVIKDFDGIDKIKYFRYVRTLTNCENSFLSEVYPCDRDGKIILTRRNNQYLIKFDYIEELVKINCFEQEKISFTEL